MAKANIQRVMEMLELVGLAKRSEPCDQGCGQRSLDVRV